MFTPAAVIDTNRFVGSGFAALAASAGVPVVSNDGDLLGPRDRVPITVYTPTEFVDMIGVFGD